MGVLGQLSLLFLLLAIGWRYLLQSPYKPVPEELGQGSFVAEGWEGVEKTFRQQLKNGLLTAGAFSVYHRGHCVVDLSGGYANEESRLLWDNQTMSFYFSTTKGVASVVMAMLVDRGLLDYKKPVSTYWPEFAQNGKKDITVEQLFSHQAGLITVNDGNYSLFDVQKNPQLWRKALEAVKPYWKPGSRLGYHAVTKGFYEDALVQIVDPKHRSMQQFFQEEVADVFGIDFYIGLPKEQFYRVAYYYPPSAFSLEVLTDPAIWAFFWNWNGGRNPYFAKAFSSKGSLDPANWNNPYFLGINSPATHGLGTASSLAKFFGILANGGVYEKKTLLSKSLIERLGQPLVTGLDIVLNLNWTIGPGTIILQTPNGGHMFGTPGYGGQNAYADLKNQLGVAYITNHMGHHLHTDPRFVGLMDAVYKSLEQVDMRAKTKP